MGWLVKIEFPVTHWPNVQAQGCMSTVTLRAVHSVVRPYIGFEDFRENLIFSTRPPILQTTPKPIKGLPMVS
jgi:hypothetical protein